MRMQCRLGLLGLSLFFIPALFNPATSHAAGYELLEQSARALGKGFAGTILESGDGSSVFYNPAAMTELDKTTFSVGANLVTAEGFFDNDGSAISPLLGGAPLTGGEGNDAAETGVFPTFYYVNPISEDWRFGLGVNAPFGLGTDYPRDWVGRYNALKSTLKVLNITPAVAYKATENLSIGAGVNVYYAEGTLGSAIDFGTIGTAALGPAAGQLGLLPQQSDGLSNFDGDSWGVGFSLGSTYRLDQDTIFGIDWRTRVPMTFDGDVKFTVPPSAVPLTAGGLFTDTDASTRIPLPEYITFAGAHKFAPDWELSAEASWTRWSRVGDLVVDFDSNMPDGVEHHNWDNSWRFSTGVEHQTCQDLVLRSGVAFDLNPISDAQHRTPRLPDADRFWLSAGASYSVSESTTIDLGYAHVFGSEEHSDVISPTGDNFVGNWDVNMDIVSLAVVVELG